MDISISPGLFISPSPSICVEMSQSEVRAALKSAREALSAKDYKEALKQCKAVLKLDKANYNAWIFAGVATSNSEQYPQAEQAYRKAIEADSNNPLAWKGLGELYVKTKEKEPAKLVEVHSKLVELSTDEQKKRESITKLAEVHQSCGNKKEAINDWKSLLSLSLCATDDTIESEVWNKVASLQEEVEVDWIEHKVDTVLAKVKAPVKGKAPEQPEVEKMRMDILQQVQEERLKKGTELDEVYEKVKALKYPSEDIYIKYIQRLLKRRKFDPEKKRMEIFEQCMCMRKMFPHSYFPLENLILLQDEDNQEMSPREVKSCFFKLLHCRPDRGMGWIGLGHYLYSTRKEKVTDKLQLEYLNEEARSLISKGLKTHPESILGWTTLASLLFEFLSFQSAISVVEKGLDFIEKRKKEGCCLHRASVVLRLILAKSYSRSKKKVTAIEVYSQILKDDPKNIEAMKGLGEIYVDQKEYNEAEKWFHAMLSIDNQSDEAKLQLGLIQFQLGNKEASKDAFKDAVQLNDQNYLAHHWLGRMYWDIGGEFRKDKAYAQTQFLLSAKLQPSFAPNFGYLGHFYKQVENDTEKAKRCYQKGFSLDALNQDCGVALSDLYLENKQHALAVSLYREVTSKSNRAAWAWHRLAIHQLAKQQFDEAVISFQTTLRVQPKDPFCWQGLAETYRRQGKYMASLKAFERAAELNSTLTYSQYQVAAIQKLLGLSEDSISQFEITLKQSPDYFPALKGLGETHLNVAREQFQNGFFSRVAHSLNNAVEIFSHCTRLRGDVTCTWKLLADAHTAFFHLPNTLCATESKKKDSNTGNFEQQIKLEHLDEGSRAYECALQLSPGMASLHYDLGVCHYFYALASKDQTKSAERLKISRACVKDAITKEPQNSTFWNCLGVVEDQPDKQQHAFIVSLQLDSRNVVSWVNLGMLYLTHGKIALAHQAFESSLSYSSNQPLAWLGEGLIHELSASTNPLPSHATESMLAARKAYRSALLSGTQAQAQLGLGYSAILLKDYSTAANALQKYVELRPLEASAHNLYGLALEGQGLLNKSRLHFETAIDLIKAIQENTKNSGEVQLNTSVTFDGAVANNARMLKSTTVNRARVLALLGVDDDSILANTQLDPTNPHNWAYLALSHFEKRDVKKSIAALEKALASTEPSHKRVIMLLLCKLHYSLQDGNKAKELAIRCTKEYPTYVRSWTTLIALALALGDSALASIGLGQLKQLERGFHRSEYSELECQFHLLQGDPQKAKSALSLGIRMFPTNVRLRIKLNQVMIHYFRSTVMIASVTRALASKDFQLPVCMSAVKPGCSYPDTLSKDVSLQRLKNMCEGYLTFGKHSPGMSSRYALSATLSAAQTSLHSNPMNIQTWFLVALAKFSLARISSSYSWEGAAKAIDVALQLFKKLQRPEPSQLAFLHLALSECNLWRGQTQKALDLLPKENLALLHKQKARCLIAQAQSGVAREQSIAESLKEYRQSIQLDPSNALSWQELSSVYEWLSPQNTAAALMCLNEYLKAHTNDRNKEGKFSTLLRASHLLFISRQYKLGLQYIEEALELFPYSAVGLAVKGMILLKLNQLEPAEQFFNAALSIDPSMATVNFYLSLVHMQSKQYQTVESDLLYEKDNSPRSDAVYYQLGKVALLCEKKESAKSYLQKAVHINPSNELYWKDLEKNQNSAPGGNKQKV